MTSSIDTIQNVKNHIASEISKIRRNPPHGVRILRKESDASDNSVSLRLFKENLFELLEDVYSGIPPEPDEDRVLRPIAQCFAVIDAPESTPYEGGHFRLRIDFFETYPDKPPRVFFLTPIFHPNVKRSGEILPAAMERDWDWRSGLRDLFQKVNVLFVQYDPAMAWNKKSQKLLFSHLEDFAAASKAFTEIFAVYDSRKRPMKSQEEDDNERLIRTQISGQSMGNTSDPVRSVNASAPMSKLNEDDKPGGVGSANQTNPENNANTAKVAPPSKITSTFKSGSANQTNPENNANTSRFAPLSKITSMFKSGSANTSSVAPTSKIPSMFKYLFGASAAIAAAAAAAIYYSYCYDSGD